MKFLSIDSSLSNTGIAAGEIYDKIIVQHIYLIQTEKTKNKKVRASSDTIARCRTTYDGVHNIIQKFKPDVIFAETPSGSQSASGMKSYGSTCQLIASISPPPIEVTPDEVKKASVGRKDASKKEIIDWAYNLYPALKWRFYKGNLQAKNEHMADAIAAIFAGIKTDEFKRLMSIVSKSEQRKLKADEIDGLY